MSVVLFGTYPFTRFQCSLPPSQLMALPIPLPPVGYMLVLAASHCQRFTFLAELSLESMPCGRLPVTSPGRNGFPGRLAVLSYTMYGMCATLVLLLGSCWPIIPSGDWLTGLVAPAHHVLAPLPSSSVRWFLACRCLRSDPSCPFRGRSTQSLFVDMAHIFPLISGSWFCVSISKDAGSA